MAKVAQHMNEYTCAGAGRILNEAASVCCTTPQCDLPQNKKCKLVNMRCGMLTADPTFVALASAAHFGGLIADGSGHAAHEANQDCSHVPKLAVHTSVLQCAETVLFNMWLASARVYSWLNELQLNET